MLFNDRYHQRYNQRDLAFWASTNGLILGLAGYRNLTLCLDDYDACVVFKIALSFIWYTYIIYISFYQWYPKRIPFPAHCTRQCFALSINVMETYKHSSRSFQVLIEACRCLSAKSMPIMKHKCNILLLWNKKCDTEVKSQRIPARWDPAWMLPKQGSLVSTHPVGGAISDLVLGTTPGVPTSTLPSSEKPAVA